MPRRKPPADAPINSNINHFPLWVVRFGSIVQFDGMGGVDPNLFVHKMRVGCMMSPIDRSPVIESI
jgi:hypothetical protein